MLPLATLLSHTLVAWTIEVDNAFELRMPHRTTVRRQRGEALRGPWLVSFPMYVHCLRHVTTNGITQGELESRARVLGPVSGLERWGYVTVTPARRDGKRASDPRAAIVRATAAALESTRVWAGLPEEVDARWQMRHGDAPLRELRDALISVVAELDARLPDYLPGIYGFGGLRNVLPGDEGLPARWRSRTAVRSESAPDPDPSSLPLYALLSKALLELTREYEREASPSLAIGANLIRVLDGVGVPVAELPRTTGVSKEAIAHSLSRQQGCVVVETAPGKRTRQARLTPRGLAAQQRHVGLISDIEQRWATRFGRNVVRALRSSLEAIVVTPELADSPLADAYGPPPGTWRADRKTPDTLPHYPMVLHRGGYPDGA
ncbi:MAG: hypothetical protein V7636_2076 [Actinomycetota bacterium]